MQNADFKTRNDGTRMTRILRISLKDGENWRSRFRPYPCNPSHPSNPCSRIFHFAFCIWHLSLACLASSAHSFVPASPVSTLVAAE